MTRDQIVVVILLITLLIIGFAFGWGLHSLIFPPYSVELTLPQGGIGY